MIGDHAVILTPDPNLPGETVDVSCLVDSVTIRYGRDDTDSQPEAASATVELSLDPHGPETLPGGLEVGAAVRVVTTTELVASTRFVGRVTDVSLGWDDAGEATPNALIAQVICTSLLAELGRRVVGDVPWPQELDGARVRRILLNAGVTLDPLWSDPGTVQILPRDVDAQAALPLAQEAASWARGVVWETRSGEVRYADAAHRFGTGASLELDTCDVFVSPTWRRSTEGLVNKVSISYGIVPEGGEQPRYEDTNPTSVARYGRYEISTATELADAADAAETGRLLLVRNSSPVWVMSSLPVDVKSLNPEDTVALLSLDMHSLVYLTGLPYAGSAPTTAFLWVEGSTETLAAGTHEIDLAVSGYCRTVPAPQWDHVDPAWLWGGGIWTVTGTNGFPNPSAETAVTGVGTGTTGQTVSWVTTDSWVGTGCFEHLNVDATANTSLKRINQGGLNYPTGETVTVRLRFKLSASTIPKWTGGAAAIFRDDGAAVTYAANVTASVSAPDAAGWRTITIVHTVPAPYTLTRVYFDVKFVGLVPGEVAWFDGWQIAPGSEPDAPYFDGDTADTPETIYAWTGTPHGSPSTRSTLEPDPGGLPPSLTWDDLTCLGPTPTSGRWADVPASTRWDNAAGTWDTYPEETRRR